MNPIRYQMNHVYFPIYLVVLMAVCATIPLVAALAVNKLWTIAPVAVAMVLIALAVALEANVRSKELKIELARWAYLFKDNVEFDGESLDTDDPETGNAYTLTRKGVLVKLPIAGEQVFDEAMENEFFLPWSDVEIVVATDNFARRVRIAAAVVDTSKRSVNGEYIPTEKEIHFLPMEEEMVGFFQKLGLDKRISVEWRYMRKEPMDAFRQILRRGYIRSLKSENGKRIKRENADNLYIE